MSLGVILERVETSEQIETIAMLAKTIWTEHYTPIIGSDQVEYMLRKFQSIDAISKDVDDQSMHYYLIKAAGQAVGYVGVKMDQSRLFLSKIYVDSSQRGSGVGKQAIEHVKAIAQTNGLGKISLTVNRHNTGTISAYEKMGFCITGELCADIGGGYVMDDYEMELNLLSTTSDC